MKRTLTFLMTACMLIALLSGCAGTVVVVNECTCPSDHAPTPTTPTPTVGEITDEGDLKTGLSVVTSVSDSTSATADAAGAVKFDVTLCAVTVDINGVIRSASIDSVPATVNFDSTGTVTSDITAAVSTKNELGENYGMVAWGGAVAEWDQQVAALCNYAVGKTVEELKNGAIDETGKAPEGSDLASSATIYLGSYVQAIEHAVANAQFLGAQGGDVLHLVTMNSIKNTVSATADAAGCAQLDADIAVVTERDGVITSCIIDSVQAKINFDATGAITTDLTAPIATKNELVENYGMVAWGGAIAEWNEQAAAFASYVTGKTAAEVAGIAVSESTKPADGSDLAASCTIAIGGFQALIAKAMG